VSTSSLPESTKNVFNPKASEYNTQLGIGYLRQGNYERAKQKLLLALKQNPDSSEANSAMAYFLEKTSAYSQAEEYYQRSISIAKEAGAAHNNYGAFLCRRGRYAQAEAQFNLAAADQNYIKPANAYENAGLCALLIPDKKMAINYFEKALQKNPNMPTSMLQLGQIYYQDRNYESSYKYLQQFLRDNEPTAESLWLAIQLAYQRGDYNSAASYGMLLKSQYANSTQYQQYIKLKAAKG
jgi:type IV pilus assembly protein PilF